MAISMLYHASSEIKNSSGCTDDLITRAKAGDDEAFGLIFDHYYRFVYKFIYAMLGERSLAEELTQETFLGAFKSIHSLRGEAKLQTWLCAIAKNVVYKSFRSHRREARRSDDEIESLNVPDEKNLSPDRQFLSKELKFLINRALEKLDTDKRLVFTLKELQNLSYKEISEITGYTIPKLKTDLNRAKIEMRGMLRDFQEVRNDV
jgi:RNA polymerase sigma-70 factor (ECF subfamily)